MNRYELIEVLKYFGVDFSQTDLEEYSSMLIEAFHFGGLTIRLKEGSLTSIKGKIPKEIARLINIKYPNNEYGINFLNLPENKKSSKNKYFESCEIESYQGLIIFFLEYIDYYNKERALKNGDLYVYPTESFEEAYENITKNIIAGIKPCMTASDWMQLDEKNKGLYNAGARKNWKNQSYSKLRMALNSFDSVINPFWVLGNKDLLEHTSLQEYLKNVSITAHTTCFYNREYCCFLITRDINNPDNLTRYIRNYDRFSYILEYTLSNEDNNDRKLLTVEHYFESQNSSDAGENLVITYRAGVWQEITNKIEINLTTQKIEIKGANEEPRVIFSCNRKETEKTINWIIEQLNTIIQYAKSITLNGLTSTGAQRKHEDNK